MTEQPNNNERPTIASGALAIGAEKAAELFDVSPSTWRRWMNTGKSPRSFKMGKGQSATVLWRVADLQAWAAAGLPDRATFEAQRQSALG